MGYLSYPIAKPSPLSFLTILTALKLAHRNTCWTWRGSGPLAQLCFIHKQSHHLQGSSGCLLIEQIALHGYDCSHKDSAVSFSRVAHFGNVAVRSHEVIHMCMSIKCVFLLWVLWVFSNNLSERLRCTFDWSYCIEFFFLLKSLYESLEIGGTISRCLLFLTCAAPWCFLCFINCSNMFCHLTSKCSTSVSYIKTAGICRRTTTM